MRRFVVNALAFIGAFSLIVLFANALANWMAADRPLGVVEAANGVPLAGVPVFLDRGQSAGVERYVTDAEGRFRFPLTPDEVSRVMWLICAPGAIPMVGTRRNAQFGATTYGSNPLRDTTWGFYRAHGWRGPIPRECPRATDYIGWRYPASAGMPRTASTPTEPDWSR